MRRRFHAHADILLWHISTVKFIGTQSSSIYRFYFALTLSLYHFRVFAFIFRFIFLFMVRSLLKTYSHFDYVNHHIACIRMRCNNNKFFSKSIDCYSHYFRFLSNHNRMHENLTVVIFWVEKTHF